MPADWQYLELGDFLMIAEAVTGMPAEALGSSEGGHFAGRLELGVADTTDRVADVLVDLATRSISEREFVNWVAERLQP